MIHKTNVMVCAAWYSWQTDKIEVAIYSMKKKCELRKTIFKIARVSFNCSIRDIAICAD